MSKLEQIKQNIVVVNPPKVSPDPILSLSKRYTQDTRPRKMNLSLGVSLDDKGEPHMPRQVARALAEVGEEFMEYVRNGNPPSHSISYLPIRGDSEFLYWVKVRLIGEDYRVCCQSQGATGAINLALGHAAEVFNANSVVVQTPSWPNYRNIAREKRYECIETEYLGSDGKPSVENFLNALDQKTRVVGILQLTCHNPTGIDYSEEDIKIIANYFRENARDHKILVVDFSYNGFIDFERERQILEIVKHCPHYLCYSCSKNFGAYALRVGVVAWTGADCVNTDLESMEANFEPLIRGINSNPSATGAHVVKMVLCEELPFLQWRQEVVEIRDRMRQRRTSLAKALPSSVRNLVDQQNGMFAFLPSNLLREAPQKIQEILIAQHAVYTVGLPSGLRINVSGLPDDTAAQRVGELLQQFITE
ncbi:MAG: aminotransferase class I/II-fold pyridoxal phosphate-dependent enzyme [Deltaproteobacteria bacterium]|nr:aminotransferase class I/II-fold pyridoxal phosphate-dependent enzyme [Deltaproteobacteria bacterium]